MPFVSAEVVDPWTLKVRKTVIVSPIFCPQIRNCGSNFSLRHWHYGTAASANRDQLCVCQSAQHGSFRSRHAAFISWRNGSTGAWLWMGRNGNWMNRQFCASRPVAEHQILSPTLPFLSSPPLLSPTENSTWGFRPFRLVRSFASFVWSICSVSWLLRNKTWYDIFIK